MLAQQKSKHGIDDFNTSFESAFNNSELKRMETEDELLFDDNQTFKQLK